MRPFPRKSSLVNHALAQDGETHHPKNKPAAVSTFTSSARWSRRCFRRLIFPETDTTCEARFNTTQPGQALSLINGDFIQERAKVLAARVKLDAGDQPEKQIATAIQLVLNRTASASEIERGQEFLQKLQTSIKLRLTKLSASSV